MTDRPPVEIPGIPLAASPSSGLVSVIMANRNGELYLERAMRSVLDQTHRQIELIVSDDGSTDGSRAIIRRLAEEDSRVRLIESPVGTGPGAARNRAIAQAAGDWIAICDSDDILHPERLERLLKSAVALGADLIADDLIYFGEDPLERHMTLLQSLDLQAPQEIDALALITCRLLGQSDLSFGYLKPMIRSSALRTIRYNEELRVDEDYDLYLRLLIAGHKFMVIPDGLYLYRRHPKSTSHRASTASLERMVKVQTDFLKTLPPGSETLAQAISARTRSHLRELRYTRLLDALKQKKWLLAIGRLIRHPQNVFSLWKSLSERFRRQQLNQSLVRGHLNLVLCAKGRAAESETPGFTTFEVPEYAEVPWSPSAAPVWAKLSQLACENDLHLLAVDRAGAFALGLVPEYASAELRVPQPSTRILAPEAEGSTIVMSTRKVQGGP